MDVVLLLLVVFTFAMLLTSNLPLGWCLFITFMAALLYLGMRYPHGKRDWPYDFKKTVYLLFTCVSLIVLVGFFYASIRIVNVPETITVAIYLLVSSFSFLFLLGLLFPEGFRHPALMHFRKR